ncbi:hypothetical protein PWG71_19655 [Nocardiopsis sp. N85]|uniref:hypothetical protein n=1 Tax=Nocardiopsis sp. N85 TaxID=3029400 RepID=UPI00237F2D8F|nr:hypothetical protein [Nocardiopsis sp. N85]MDE3723612.1 hypothetical protein [Nocardiopsis sp. N85]
MIVLTVLFGALVLGIVVIGVLLTRVRRAAGALARQVARASDEHRAGDEARPLLGHGGTGTSGT